MAGIKRIPTGIPGLDRLIEGGLVANRSVVVVGESGTGKSTFALQYIRNGAEQGIPCLYISLEETTQQIIEGAVANGWIDIERYVDENTLTIVEIRGKELKEFIDTTLVHLAETMADPSGLTRVAVDSLTPLAWAMTERYEQREEMLKMFLYLKKIGTVVATVESGHRGEGGEEIVPIFLADGAFELRVLGAGGVYNQVFRIKKMRWTNHARGIYPYYIIRDIGMVIEPVELAHEKARLLKESKKAVGIDEKKIQRALKLKNKLPANMQERYEHTILSFRNWEYPYNVERVFKLVMDDYKRLMA